MERVAVSGGETLVLVHTCGKSPRLKEIVDKSCSLASRTTTCYYGSGLTKYVV